MKSDKGHHNKNRKYTRTRKGLIASIYGSQKRSSINRNHPKPSYSLEILREWCFNQLNFESVYSDWVESDYKTSMIPSVDRKDDYVPYTLDNLLRVCTWEENKKRGLEDRKNGINNKQSICVIQKSLDGEFIAEYWSLSQANRETGIHRGHISDYCKGINNYSHVGGFKWEFKT